MMRFYFVISLCLISLSSRTQTLTEFEDYVTQLWSPAPSSKAVLSEFLNIQVENLRSELQQMDEWTRVQRKRDQKGEFLLSRCIGNQHSAIALTGKRARELLEKLLNAQAENTIDSQTFKALTRVGTLRSTYSRIQDAIADCELQARVGLKDFSFQAEVHSFRARGKVSHAQFTTLMPFEPAARPYR